MQDEKDNPIDIHADKLLDWLISRRHCNREWNDKVLLVRRKINDAIQDMPASEAIANILSGTYINYYSCLQIVEILKDTESDTKNFFGWYSSQRMKDWVEVVNLYKKDNLYLAEAAQMLVRNVNYEIPALKRRLTKLQNMQQDCLKKSHDCVKNGNDLKEKYNSMCHQYGITGKDLKSELLQVGIRDLPKVFEEVVNLAHNLADAALFYDAFTQYTQSKDDDDTPTSLPLLRYLMEKGNTTTYEWRFGKKPTSIEETKLETKENEETNDEIDFGDGDTIDFGGDQIDFGDESTTNDSIDFGTDEPFEIVDVISIESEDVAKGEDALTILENYKTRSNFSNELLELEAFLNHRLYEMQSDDDFSTFNQFQEMNPIIQRQSSESIQKMSAAVRRVLNALDNNKTQQAFLIKSSPSYLNRLVNSFKDKLLMSKNMLEKREVYEKKRDELRDEEVEIHPKIDIIVAKTKELQKQIEDDISTKYKNRPVNLMGIINVI